MPTVEAGEGQIGHPEEPGAVQLADAGICQNVQRLVEAKQHRHLDQQRQTPAQGIEAGFLVELHLLFGQLLAILAVFLLQLTQLRLQLLLRLGRLGAV